MAPKLINELTWSVSRYNLFQECQRAYFYNYYGAWDGWNSDAPDKKKLLYRLKKMQSLDIWAGSIVHDTIAEALRRYSMKQSAITAGELQAHARRKLRTGWMEAVNKDWLSKPKRTNLQELYYGNGKTLPREQTERIRQRVNTCLTAFAESDVLREILATPYINWKTVDELESFVLGSELKVWCALDFAYIDPSGHLRILDWKTGRERSGELRLQLACYSLFASDRWHMAFEHQHPAAVFLGDTARVSEYDLTPEELVDAKNTILTSAVSFREKLTDVGRNLAREQDFPVCGNERTCQRCNFREVCPSTNGTDEPFLDDSIQATFDLN